MKTLRAPSALALAVALPWLLVAPDAGAIEPVASFGEWSTACEQLGGAARCVVTASEERWDDDMVRLVYHPEQRSLSVTVAGLSFGAQARIDRGPATSGDCLSMLCDFARGGFGQALEEGTVLFVTVTAPGKKPLTFAKNLLDLRKAVAAAKAWSVQSH